MDCQNINERFKKFINSIRGIDISTDLEIYEIECLQEFITIIINFLKKIKKNNYDDFDQVKFKYYFVELKNIYKNIGNKDFLFYKCFLSIIEEIKILKIDFKNAIDIKKNISMINFIREKIKISLNNFFEILTIRLFNMEIELIFKYLKTIIDYDTFFFLGEIVNVFMNQRSIFLNNIGQCINYSVCRKFEYDNNNISENIIENESSKKQKCDTQEINNNNLFVRQITINVPNK